MSPFDDPDLTWPNFVWTTSEVTDPEIPRSRILKSLNFENHKEIWLSAAQKYLLLNLLLNLLLTNPNYCSNHNYWRSAYGIWRHFPYACKNAYGKWRQIAYADRDICADFNFQNLLLSQKFQKKTFAGMSYRRPSQRTLEVSDPESQITVNRWHGYMKG